MNPIFSRFSLRRILPALALLGSLLHPAFQAPAQEVAPALRAQDLAALRWRELGPAITSGRITAFAVHPRDTRIIYAASASGGAWKTVNGGTTWAPVFQNEGSVSLGALALAALTLTTLDSFARTSRYVVQELAGPSPNREPPSGEKGRARSGASGARAFIRTLFAKSLGRPLGASLFVALGGIFLYSCIPFLELWNGLVLGGLLLLLLPFAILLLDRVEQRQGLRLKEVLHLLLPIAFLFPTTLAGLLYLFYKYTIQEYHSTGGVKWVSTALVLFLLVLLFSLVLQFTKKLFKVFEPASQKV